MVIQIHRLNCGEQMSNANTEPKDEYGDVEINDRGRLTIPKALRDELQIDGGTTFTVVREDGDIRLVRNLPELETVSAGDCTDWGEETFRDAGEATFGGR